MYQRAGGQNASRGMTYADGGTGPRTVAGTGVIIAASSGPGRKPAFSTNRQVRWRNSGPPPTPRSACRTAEVRHVGPEFLQADQYGIMCPGKAGNRVSEDHRRQAAELGAISPIPSYRPSGQASRALQALHCPLQDERGGMKRSVKCWPMPERPFHPPLPRNAFTMWCWFISASVLVINAVGSTVASITCRAGLQIAYCDWMEVRHAGACQ